MVEVVRVSFLFFYRIRIMFFMYNHIRQHGKTAVPSIGGCDIIRAGRTEGRAAYTGAFIEKYFFVVVVVGGDLGTASSAVGKNARKCCCMAHVSIIRYHMRSFNGNRRVAKPA